MPKVLQPPVPESFLPPAANAGNAVPLPPPDLRHGHRARLRERFRRQGLDGMLNYEVLELLLTLLIPQRDVKPLAKQLLERFGSVNGVLDAAPEQLQTVSGIGETTAVQLGIVRALATYYLEQRCWDSDDLSSPRRAADFARMKLGSRCHECHMILFLNAQNRLIEFEVNESGTVDRSAFYVRNAVERALLCHAVKMILIHNHPSGICTPSPEDLQITIQLKQALALFSIGLQDHLIVGKSSFLSFAQAGLLSSDPETRCEGKQTQNSLTRLPNTRSVNGPMAAEPKTPPQKKK